MTTHDYAALARRAIAGSGALSILRDAGPEPVNASPATFGDGTGARWHFADGAHHIELDDTGFGFREGLPERMVLQGMERALRHETLHALHTQRGTFQQEALENHRLPRYLQQFFEDARIEELGRRQFGWDFDASAVLEIPPVVEHPAAFFHVITACNGDVRIAMTHATLSGMKKVVRYRGWWYRTERVIADFHRRATEATSTTMLWHIIVEWCDVFKAFEDPPQQQEVTCKLPVESPKAEGEGEGEGEGEAKAKGKPEPGDDEDDDEEPGDEHGVGFGGLWDPSKPITRPASKGAVTNVTLPPPPKELKKADEDTTVVVDEHKLDPFSDSKDSGVELDEAPAIAQKLRRMIAATDASKQRSAASGARLNIGSVMVGASDSFRVTRSRTGKRRVCLLMDMSGSMSGNFHQHGGAFLEALLILDRQGVLDADLYLTGGGQYYKLPKGTPTSIVRRLSADLGCESVDATLKHAKPDVIAADTVIIYTDGNLTDGDVKAGEWRQHGVDLIGVAVGTYHTREQLERHFHRGIVASDGTTLAAAIAQYVLTHS